MSRRLSTIINVQLTIRIPPGSNAAQVLGFIKSALLEHKTRGELKAPISAIDLDSMIMRLTKRETTYL